MSTARPDADGKLIPENDKVTRAKILAWASFTYEVATGQIPATASYCSQFGGNRSVIAPAMVPNGFNFCITADRPQGWTVGRLFSWRCGKIFIFFGRCNLLKEDAEFIQNVAKGALLHLVQDSFSQSHVSRTNAPDVDAGGTPLPRVECGKPRGYVAYTAVTAKGHGQADKWPRWNASCDAPKATDVIAASAMVMHHIDRKTTTEDFLRYLETSVF
jgi:hypothetical protein